MDKPENTKVVKKRRPGSADTGGKKYEKVVRIRRLAHTPYSPASSSPDSSTKQLKKRRRAEEDEYALARKSSASDEVDEGKKFKKPKTDHFSPETPNVQNKTESGKRRRSEEDDQPVARKLSFDDEDEEGYETASPENILLIKHLKQLSEMEPSLKKTDSALYELLINNSADSKFSDAWKNAGRGIKQLKEGLRTISEVQKLLCSTYTDDDSTPEHQE